MGQNTRDIRPFVWNCVEKLVRNKSLPKKYTHSERERHRSKGPKANSVAKLNVMICVIGANEPDSISRVLHGIWKRNKERERVCVYIKRKIHVDLSLIFPHTSTKHYTGPFGRGLIEYLCYSIKIIPNIYYIGRKDNTRSHTPSVSSTVSHRNECHL